MAVAQGSGMTSATEQVSSDALNPRAREFLPWWRLGGSRKLLSADAPEFILQAPGTVAADTGGDAAPAAGRHPDREAVRMHFNPQEYDILLWGKRRAAYNYWLGAREPGAAYKSRRRQRIDVANKTIFVTDTDHSVTEEMLATLFRICATVVHCRICGYLMSGFRYAFIELQSEDEAYVALFLDGAIIGPRPLRVSPSRTSMRPINPRFLPQSEAEREVCSRTVYCSNISKNVEQRNLKAFFEGKITTSHISHLKLLGDDWHATNIAFIEFVEIHGAIAALNSSGIFAGGIPIRVSPSKTVIKGGNYRASPAPAPSASGS
ncbi:hypothetical protein ACP70R_006632 [Stipagrostis hirtigluma subsp. patula]